MRAMPNQVLIIEDESDLAALLALHLSDAGCQSEVCANGAEGLQRCSRGSWNLIVLDLCLPGMDGMEICRRIRARNDHTPLLILSSRCTEQDRVAGLESGADDYVTKPFSVLEFVARVKALLRRPPAMMPQSAGPARRLRVKDMLIDLNAREVSVGGHGVELTAREFDLLAHFARNPGRVYSRAQLLDDVWGFGYQGYEHTVNSHINRLRAKIEDNPSLPRFIKTIWGVGYKFETPEARAL
ncbi:MAG: response regulator transcription factor [Gammaproteobacteria bacterium]